MLTEADYADAGTWSSLIFGVYDRRYVQIVVADDTWQRVRASMLGATLPVKYATLIDYLSAEEYTEEAQCRVTNYVNALKRGGVIK